ncbi:iron-containing alcohol dehydrogenase [Bartonella sp. LJL80]
MTEMNLHAEWIFPTRIALGAGRLAGLEDLLQRAEVNSVMVITDRGLALSNPLKKLLRRIDKSQIGFGVFSALDGAPDREILELAVRLYRSGGFNGILAFGGGSAIDLAKLTALFCSGDADCRNLLIPRRDVIVPPVIAVPTLAGSGAEVEESAYLATNDAQGGRTFNDPRLRPSLVVMDPQLAATASSAIIAGAGMNALVHAVDSWCSPFFNPAADALAVETIRLVFGHLPKAVSEPQNLEAQTYMLSASVSGALAATKGLGATMALAHSVCHRYHTHFGMTAGVLLPYVLAFNQPVIEARINLLNDRLGIKGGFNGFASVLLALRKTIGVPTKLGGLIKDKKIKAKDKALIDGLAIEDPAAGENPIRLTKKAALEILNAAIAGKMNRKK